MSEEEIKNELKDHKEILKNHTEKLTTLMPLKDHLAEFTTTQKAHGLLLTAISTQITVIATELPHIAEREDSKIQKHLFDCIIKQEKKDNPGKFTNSNTFSAFGGVKLPRNAPKWLIWLVFGTAMALAGKLSEAITIFRITQ